MEINHTRKVGQRKRRILFPGIGRVADELGVTRQHLYLVLTGERDSPKRAEAVRLLGLSRERSA